MKQTVNNLKRRVFTLVTLIFVTFASISGTPMNYEAVAPEQIPLGALTAYMPIESPEISSNISGLGAPKSSFVRESALFDPYSRVSQEFAVPEGFERRVAFWFDVYSKYNSQTHVIHHVRYPWIIFRVVDTSTLFQNPKLHRWTKYHRAKKLVSQEIARVRKSLIRLSKLKSYKRIHSEDRAIYNALLEIPGKRNAVIRAALKNLRVQLGQRDFFLTGLQSSTKYLPYMEEEFSQAGMPTELTRLPFVESSFNELAVSDVGASGIWQIMPSTGRMFRLRVDQSIDERNSPLKASLAAIEILRDNKRILKTWPLAMTAYNHGATGIRSALKASRTTDLVDLVAKYYRGNFQFASANFYACFLAALHTEKYHREIFTAEELTRLEPMPHVVFEVRRSIRAKNLLASTRLPKDQFLKYNLDLRDAWKRNAFIPKGYKLLLPPSENYPAPKNILREAVYIIPKKSRRT